MMRVTAQQQREMRPRQLLLKIRGASVHENLGVGEAVAGTRPALCMGSPSTTAGLRWKEPLGETLANAASTLIIASAEKVA